MQSVKVADMPLSSSLQRSGASHGGHVYWVKPKTAADWDTFYKEHYVQYKNGKSSVHSTLTAAISAAAASVGDVIFVSEGYTETITTASGVALNKAGVSVFGLGGGNDRPTITISSTDNAGTVAISSNNCVFKNFVIVGNDDALTNAVVVTGNNCDIDIETHDTSSAIEMATAVRLDTADNCILKLKHLGFTAGNAMVSAVRIDDCDNVRIDIDGFGVLTTAWVEMVDVASTNVYVSGRTFTQAVTDGSRDVVDTITGSTWYGEIEDMSAGRTYSGGSAQAWASDDVSGLAAAIDAIDNFVDTEVASILTASGAVTDAADYTPGATASSMISLIKGVLGTQVLAEGTFTTSSATVPADTGRTEANDYFNGCYIIPVAGSIAGQARQIVDFANAGGVFTLDADLPFTAVPGTVAYIIVPGPNNTAAAADSTAATSTRHTIGNKADAVDYTAGATASSLMALLKGVLRMEVLAEGTFTTSSTTVPADTGKTEGNDYWNGCYLIPLSGDAAFQPRLIADFANAGGVFTLDSSMPFTSAPGTVAYAIVRGDASGIVATADNTSNTTVAQVIGNKADATATGAVTTTDSLMAYAKQLVTELQVVDEFHDVPAADNVLNAQINEVIGNKTDATATGAVTTTDTLVGYTKQLVTELQVVDGLHDVPSADVTTNSQMRDVIGNKADAAATDVVTSTDSLMAYVKQLVTAQPKIANKTYADLVGYDTAAAFTVTGDVLVRVWGVVGGTGITSTSGTTTLSVGTTADADACLPSTTIDNSDFAAGDVWVDNNPEDDAGAVATTAQVIIGGGADIVLTRNVDDILGGVLTLYCEWVPLSVGATVVPA